MKKIILILFLTFGMLSYSQVNDSIPSKISETERIVDKYSDKIYTVVQELAKSLSVPAEYVYKVLVKQAVVDAVTYLIFLTIGILLFIPLFKVINKVTNWHNCTDSNNNNYEGQFTIGIIMALGGLMLTLTGLFHISDITQGFINPEYKAIETIINSIK